MNIFATDPDPRKAADALDDKRIVKMIVESAQMLSTAIHEMSPKVWQFLLSESQDIATYQGYKTIYFPTHVNHPCNVWVRETVDNFSWLYSHASRMLAIYTDRYERRHASATCINIAGEHWDILPTGGLTPFANAARRKDMDIDFTHIEDTHEAYRLYLKARWARDKRIPTWEGRGLPTWMIHPES